MSASAEIRIDRYGGDRRPALEPGLTITDNGWVLGGTVLARIGRGDDRRPKLEIDGAEDRILALLAAVYGKAVGPAVPKNICRASAYWGQGEQVLAAIELALAGLPPLADPEAARRRLDRAEKRLAAGIPARELIKACGLDPARFDLVRAGYNPDSHASRPAIPPAANGSMAMVQKRAPARAP